MDHFRTQYEKLYDSEEYYWGLEPADFLKDLIAMTGKSPKALKVLDIGCGEGKDAVWLTEQGCSVTAFDLTESGIRKTKRLAEQRGVTVNAYVSDINNFSPDGTYDVIYSTGTIQYLKEENISLFFQKIEEMTVPGGLVFLNVFVDKPFIPLPPDWDREERMWTTGALFTHFANWKIRKMEETIFEDLSGGIRHFHCMDTVIAEKV